MIADINIQLPSRAIQDELKAKVDSGIESNVLPLGLYCHPLS